MKKIYITPRIKNIPILPSAILSGSDNPEIRFNTNEYASPDEEVL